MTGRPVEEIGGLKADYQLIELVTGKVVLKDSTFAHVGYDIPGSMRRFAKQRAMLDAQERAANVAAEARRYLRRVKPMFADALLTWQPLAISLSGLVEATADQQFASR